MLIVLFKRCVCIDTGIGTKKYETIPSRFVPTFSLYKLYRRNDLTHERICVLMTLMKLQGSDLTAYLSKPPKPTFETLTDNLRWLLEQSPDGMSKTAIYRALGNNVPFDKIDAALCELVPEGLTMELVCPPKGRPKKIFSLPRKIMSE